MARRYKCVKNKNYSHKKTSPYDTISFYSGLEKLKETMNVTLEYHCDFHYFRLTVHNSVENFRRHFILTKLDEHGSSPEQIVNHVVACTRDAMRDIAKEEQQMVDELKPNEEIYQMHFFGPETRKQLIESEVFLGNWPCK